MALVVEASQEAVAGGLLAAVAFRDPVQGSSKYPVQSVGDLQYAARAAGHGVEHDDANVTAWAAVQRPIDVAAAQFQPQRGAFEQGVEQRTPRRRLGGDRRGETVEGEV